MSKDQVYCKNCDWNGSVYDLNGIKCPNCEESEYINDVEPEYYYDNEILGGGDFNWNKK